MLPVQGHGEEIPARRGKEDLTIEFRKVGRAYSRAKTEFTSAAKSPEGAKSETTDRLRYPNANFMISPNLITQTQPPARAALTSRDAASLAVAQQWLADPRFANLGPELQNIIVRLQTFVQQANQGP